MDERMQDIEKFAQYLHRRSPERRTSLDYVSDIRQFAAHCPKAWREVSLQDVDAFVDQQRQKGLSPATLKRRVSALKVFFDFLAEEQGDLSWPNPVRFKRHAGKPPKRLPRDLTNSQVEQLWQVINSPRDRAWFVLMLRAGLRVGEVTGLKLSDLLTAPTLEQPARLRVLGKGHKERLVLLTADAYAVLQEWLKQRPPSESQAVFLNDQGQPLSANGLEWLLRRYSQPLGFKATPHQLRHTFARQLREEGMPLPSLSKLLGHAQISTTEIYTAGADPQLVQAYQSAMGQLAQLPPPPATPPEALVPPPAPAPTPLPVASHPDWAKWAPDLPEAIRQACLAFVQHRLKGWKPQRQRVHAQRALGHLSRFWRWQLAQRPIQQPSELQLSDLQAFQQAQLQAGLAASSINTQLDELLALLRELAQQAQPIDPALFRLRYLPRAESLPRHLSELDSRRLEHYLQNRLEQTDPLIRLENACFFILAHTGLRASECLDLQGQDLDLAGQRLIVRQGKGQRDRIVYLSATACQALQAYLVHTPLQLTLPLLRLPNGQPLTYPWLYTHLSQLGQAAGQIKVTPHQLRHTLATRLLNVGMPVTHIQKLLGHDNLNTTMIYARVLDVTLQAEYQRAMSQIERQQTPLSRTPQLAPGWPVPQPLEPLTQFEPTEAYANFV
jgi:site-specific recombinase XerD